jgi:radical SAM superfamily enzyme YgiQ (UPF0313 family)
LKITFILPAIGKKENKKYIKTWKMEPLTIAVLKALTPPDIETEFFDDRLELINYDTKTDLVAVSVETYTARRAYNIAQEFNKRGVLVIMGGYHPTMVPQEAAHYADSVLIGNAEGVWAQVIEDLKRGALQKSYRGDTAFSGVLPDRSIYSDKKYSPLSLIETGRGCPYKCEFCAISSYYKSSYCPRPIKSVVKDIEKAKHRHIFFIDDNVVADRDYCAKLLTEITPLKVKWTSQGALTLAKDKQLLRLMKISGCEMMLIGFESLDDRNLNQMKKEWNFKLGEKDELVKRIHDAGISIYATFVFGFDYDTPASFEKAIEFSLKHDFFFVAFNHLLPFPGTPVYERLKSENRLIKEKWWLEPGYKYGDIPYMPKNMSPEELSERCAQARREFFGFSSIFKRGIKLLQRDSNPILSLIYWSQNFNLRNEVDGKLSLPVGSGLDELPK